MKKYLLACAVSLLPLPAAAVPQYVDAGDTADGGIVNQIVDQYVSGTSQNQTVYGEQYIESGGKAFNTTVASYGSQTVESGGTADKTTVQYYGTASVFGTAANFTVESYGSMTVQNAGTATGTNVAGGSVFVKSGGTLENTYVSSGKLYTRNDGTDKDTVLNGGTHQVDNGGTSEGARIYGGFQHIEGTVENSFLYGGKQSVLSTGKLISGTVDGGELFLSSFSEASDLTVKSGSVLIDSDVELTGTTLLSAGGEINSYGDVNFDSLQMAGGKFSLIPSYIGQSVNIGSLSGNGIFYLNSEVSAGENDELVVQNATGTFNIGLIDYSSDVFFPDSVRLVRLDSGNADFNLIGGAADIGAYRYDMYREGDEWILKRTPIPSDTSVIAKNTFASIQSVFYAHQNNLNSHIQDIRSSKRAGFWAKGFKRKVKFDFSDGSKSKTDIWGGQIGVDFRLPQEFAEYMIVGAYWGHSDSRQRFDRSGTADADTHSVGIYTTVHVGDGFFVNADVAYYRHNQNILSYLPMGKEVFGHYRTDGWSATVQTGKRFAVKSVWYVEPDLRLTYMSLGNIRYQTSLNTPVYGRNASSFIGKAGVTGGRSMKDVLGLPSEAFVNLGILREFSNHGKVRVADRDFKEDLSDTLYETGFGFNVFFNEKFGIYANFAAFFGDRVSVPVSTVFGGQLSW